MYIVISATQQGKPAHWAVFIPDNDFIDGKKGKIIHNTGNPATGFTLEFRRGADYTNTRKRYMFCTLAQVHSNYIRDVPVTAELNESTARDPLESVATTVPNIGRSPKPFDHTHPETKNCQDWIHNYIEALIAAGYISTAARDALANMPKFI
ncbi:hypothetical protein EJ05DRAFT_492585 [Pseudovirgaria hyperparasitica]|uniref:Uncharacterized protein n=1 Tax=Pseudovirgaria hyperparasitica TaxID=470096 RepID=A0A6A6W989_9PEZI|nr:uncharacterized protein EJ05DRAFT_492585 [Pseudovirgaria hyperparasitica]KAF2759115.1 hypothetical protein EJ05DRAFT_492585 [Pseudovirgaria hyperparasitica]